MTTATATRLELTSGLGKAITIKPKTWLDVVEFADLDFEVAMADAYTHAGGKFRPVPGRTVTYRTDTNDPLGVVRPSYQIVQNADALSFLDPLIAENAITIKRAGVVGNGERIFVDAQIGDQFTIGDDIQVPIAKSKSEAKQVGDLYEPRIMLQSSHDGTRALTGGLYCMRLACTNGMSVPHALREFKIRHSGDTNAKIDAAADVLRKSLVYAEQFKHTADKMLARHFSDDDMLKFTRELIPTKDEDKVPARVQARRDALIAVIRNGTGLAGFSDTGWGLYNATVEYVDHVAYGDKDDARARFMSLLEGNAQRFKDRAFALLTN